jgi:hypothetical protein
MGTGRQYDLSRIAVSLGGVLIDEYSSDGLSHDTDGDDWSFVSGSHGSVVASKMNNNISTLTLNVMQGSPAQQRLSDLRAAGLLAGFFSVLVKDALGTTLISAAQAKIIRPAPINFGEEAQGYEWTIKLLNPFIAHGVNLSL